MIDITKETWWLPRDVWGRMSVTERRQHCFNVNAYFRSEARRNRGEPPDDFTDRLDAEREMNSRIHRAPQILMA